MTGGATASALRAAGLALQAGRLAEAERTLNALLAEDPTCPETLHVAGIVAARRGQAKRAQALLEHALARQPGNAEIRSNYGQLLSAAGRRNEAIAELQRARALAPRSARIAARLAQELRAVGAVGAAIGCLREQLARGSDNARLWLDLAQMLIDVEQQEDAGTAVRRVLAAVSPAAVSERRRAGSLLLRLGAPAEAAAVFQALLVDNRDEASIWNDFGTACLRLGRFEVATDAFRHAQSLALGDDKIAFNLASALEQAGSVDDETLIAAYRRAITLNPSAAGHWSKLLAVYAGADRLEELAAHMADYVRSRRVRGFFWKEPYYGLLLVLDGWVQSGRTEDVIAVLHRVISATAPLDPLVTDWFRFLLGALHLRRGEEVAGRSLLKAASGHLPFLQHVCLGAEFDERCRSVSGDDRARFQAALMQEGGEIGSDPRNADADDREAISCVVLCACDPSYLRRFGRLFALSIDLFASSSVLIHIHVVGPDDGTAAEIDAIRRTLSNCRVSYTWEHLLRTLSPAGVRTYYTCARFLRLPDLLIQYGKPMVVADIDSLFLGDPADIALALEPERPVALLFSPTTLAYLYDGVGGGLLAVRPEAAAVQVFDQVRDFLLSWFFEGRMHYFLDQVALGRAVGVPDYPKLAVGVQAFERRGSEVSLGGCRFVQMRLEKTAEDFDQRIEALIVRLLRLRDDPAESADGLRFALRQFAGTC